MVVSDQYITSVPLSKSYKAVVSVKVRLITMKYKVRTLVMKCFLVIFKKIDRHKERRFIVRKWEVKLLFIH